MLVSTIILLFSGCGSGGSGGGTTGEQPTESSNLQLSTTEPAIYGTVTDIQNISQRTSRQGNSNRTDSNTPVSSKQTTGKEGKSGNVIGVVLIEEKPDEESGSQKDSVTITKRTTLLDQQEQGLISAEFEDFELGQQVRAWYSGPVAESYPRQATARVVVIESQG